MTRAQHSTQRDGEGSERCQYHVSETKAQVGLLVQMRLVEDGRSWEGDISAIAWEADSINQY